MLNGGCRAAVDDGSRARGRLYAFAVDNLPARHGWGRSDRGRRCGRALSANHLTVPGRGWKCCVAAGVGAGHGVVESC